MNNNKQRGTVSIDRKNPPRIPHDSESTHNPCTGVGNNTTNNNKEINKVLVANFIESFLNFYSRNIIYKIATRGGICNGFHSD